MGVVVLQLGQGGNQQGFSFLNAMANSALMDAASLEDFFHEGPSNTPIARCVLIDMEPKVVAAVIKKANASKIWKYGKHHFTRDSGSGNNWAQGFYSHGPACRVPILDLIRLEVEACDNFDGFLMMQSMAGGTGSGLGAYLMEAIRDEYPAACLMSYCIWPFESGEVVVQNYNALLTLSHLQNHADGVIIVKNDTLSGTCKRALGIHRPSFTDMNRVAAQSLASVLLPAYWRPPQTGKGCSSGLTSGPSTSWFNSGGGLSVRKLSDLVLNLCAHPGYRMLALHSTPQISAEALDFTTLSWGSQLKQLKRMFTMDSLRENLLEKDFLQVKANNSTAKDQQGPKEAGSRLLDRAVANFLVLRGRDSETVNVDMFHDSRMYPLWSVDPFKVAVHEETFGNLEIFAGLLSNCQVAILPASHVLSRAYAMYTSRAYIHHYAEYGLTNSEFSAAFATVEDILARYLAL